MVIDARTITVRGESDTIPPVLFMSTDKGPAVPAGRCKAFSRDLDQNFRSSGFIRHSRR